MSGWRTRRLMALLIVPCGLAAPIDREALVTRHNVTLTDVDPLEPLSVGNGSFAFTADITGLQTFPEAYTGGIPLHTMAQWGWHSFRNPERFSLEDVLNDYEVAGRSVPYVDGEGTSPRAGGSPRTQRAFRWLRANPHRLDLGRIGLVLTRDDGVAAAITDVKETRQSLNLWVGELSSRFVFQGEEVMVTTVVHPQQDVLAVRIESSLVEDGRCGVKVAFPYGSGDWRGAADWDQSTRHRTRLEQRGEVFEFARRLDQDRYWVMGRASSGAIWTRQRQHQYKVAAVGRRVLELVFRFSEDRVTEELPTYEDTLLATADGWREFWNTGGAIDFTGSTDPRAHELERRVVLSQFLTAIHCAGELPPQETGLVMNSWHGKFHLEMHWWHAVHFALWGRPHLLERSLAWYETVLPQAQATAQSQGYRGARWPKMVGPDGRESPSGVGPFLIWQQPHFISFAELLYRADSSREMLERWHPLVLETAEFMASYARWEEQAQKYVLGPPLIPAQESYGRDRARVINPTYELAYWHWGLATARDWQRRLGQPVPREWDAVIAGLARPRVTNGIYAAIEVGTETIYRDHPSMLAALGVLPKSPMVEEEIMRRTLDDVWARWDWASTWGWDYPMMAMSAARLGEPEQAVAALFMESPKNRFLKNGHNYQSPRLPLYLPGNGGLLAAVAMMAAGWDGAGGEQPVFSRVGGWVVRSEGLVRAP